jgi:hypothetical protein
MFGVDLNDDFISEVDYQLNLDSQYSAFSLRKFFFLVGVLSLCLLGRCSST